MDKNGLLYAAATAGTVSAPRLVTITPPGPNDPRLPSPAITEGNVLDLSRFTGDAHATMNPWILITEGQRVWLWIIHDGGTIDVLTGHAVTAADIAFGLSIAVPRDTLAAIGAGKELSIHAAVNYEGGSIKPADTFPARTYRMANGSVGMGTETMENFRGVGSVSLTPGQIILFPDTRLTMEIHSANFGAIKEEKGEVDLIPPIQCQLSPRETPAVYRLFLSGHERQIRYIEGKVF